MASITEKSRSFTYDQVNNAVCEVFFDGRYRHQPLYLDLEGAVLDDVARVLGIPADACTDAIASATAGYLSWKSSDPFGRFTGDLLAWDVLGRTEPLPCVGLLCTLAIAAERMRSDEVYSAHNYYERLFEVLDVSEETQKTKLRAHAKSTKPFWLSLNQWLAEHDFEFGRPTAKRVNDWAYVSYALSQALVRDADRQRFHRMFEEVGFRPGEQVSDQEMLLYLHEWLRGPAASQWLKKLWTEPDLRGRVAQAARAELEHWNGDPSRADGLATKRRTLNWAASLIQFPVRRLQLYLSAARQEGEEPTALRLAQNPSPAATEAFRECEGALWLANVPGDEFSVLEPVRSIAIRPLMLSSFALTGEDGELTRVARAVVPMLRLEAAPYYREVSRISLLLPHLILCHEQWQPKVQAYLAANARPGFNAVLPSELSGLPLDWVLFTNVEVLRRPEFVPQDLEVLAPLSEGVALNLDGGLRLSQGLWHAEQPPEIVAAAPEGKISIELRQLSLKGAVAVLAESTPQSLASTLSLQDSALPASGDFTVAALQGGKVRSECSLSLRSADCPRRLNADLSELSLALRPDVGSTVLAGESGPIPDGLPVLKFRGLSTTAVGTAATNETPSLAAQPLAEAGENDEDVVRSYADRDPGALGESCVLRSHHVYVIEPFTKGDDPHRPRWGKCKDCGDSVFFKGRPTRRRPPITALRGRAPQQPIEQITEREPESVDPDLLFDAICYLGSGKWDRLLGLAGELADDPWFPGRFADNLRLLGHIDVLLDERGRRPQSFICAPPVMAITDGGNALLAGFRCGSLVAQIADRLRPISGVQHVSQEAAPPALIWRGISSEAAAEALAGVSDPFGRTVEIVKSPGAAFASYSPAISSAIGSLPNIHIENAPALERFDTARGHWRRAASLDEPGAYRTDFAGKRYFYCFDNGELKEGTHEVVKLIAAREASIRLHSYDPRAQTFDAVVGCAPPGLLGRALVSCSGMVPVRQGAKLTYRNVPHEIGNLVLHKLYT